MFEELNREELAALYALLDTGYARAARTWPKTADHDAALREILTISGDALCEQIVRQHKGRL